MSIAPAGHVHRIEPPGHVGVSLDLHFDLVFATRFVADADIDDDLLVALELGETKGFRS